MKKKKPVARRKTNAEVAEEMKRISDRAIAAGLKRMTMEEIEKEVERRRGTA